MTALIDNQLTTLLADRIERPELMDMLGVKSPATVYRLIEEQGLPAPQKLTPSKRGRAFWRRHEIQEWLDNRPTMTQGGDA